MTSIGYRGITLNDSTISFSNPNTIIDLGAVAKGYIADKIKEYLIEQGVDSAIINLGGNVLCVEKRIVMILQLVLLILKEVVTF